MVLGDQNAVVVPVDLRVALVIEDDQLDRPAQQAAVAVHVAGPQLIALLAGQPVGLEPPCLLRSGQRQRDPDGDRLAGGAGQQGVRVVVTAQTARSNGNARGGHRHEAESLGVWTPHRLALLMCRRTAGVMKVVRGARWRAPRTTRISPGPRPAWD